MTYDMSLNGAGRLSRPMCSLAFHKTWQKKALYPKGTALFLLVGLQGLEPRTNRL